jgi:hypothetical protein
MFLFNFRFHEKFRPEFCIRQHRWSIHRERFPLSLNVAVGPLDWGVWMVLGECLCFMDPLLHLIKGGG